MFDKFNPFTAVGNIIGSERAAWQERRDFQDSREDASRAAELAYERQKEFAQMGIQWRTEDAKKAGLHPVFALGGGGAAFSPSVAVAGGGSYDAPSFGAMGQDVSRAAKATMTPEQRALHDMQVALLQSQINRNNADANLSDARALAEAGQQGPGMPVTDPNLYAIPGQNPGGARPGSGANVVKLDPSEAESYATGRPDVAAARNPFMAEFVGPGGIVRLPSKRATEALESVSESLIQQYLWLRLNMRENPNFMRENAWAVPYGEEMYALGDAYRKYRDRPRMPAARRLGSRELWDYNQYHRR